MRIGDAKALARQWVIEQASHEAGFVGAFYHGSSNWLPDDAILPATSDLDVMVVFEEPPQLKLGKFLYGGVLLEVSYLAREELQSPEELLRLSHLAGSFRTPGIILDPTGHLTKLQQFVGFNFARRYWVRKRCEHVHDKIERNLQSLEKSTFWPNQVNLWLFAAGLTTHVLLVAGLKNPTVRRRYAAVRQLLAEYDRLDFYPSLLGLLGCDKLSREQVETQLAALTTVFDYTKTVVKTPVFFASDLTDVARPLAIDGSWELIRRGLHREAVFWIVATYARCQQVLQQDASVETYEHFDAGLRQILADLDIASLADLKQRSKQVKAFLPTLWAETEAIMAQNPEIEV